MSRLSRLRKEQRESQADAEQRHESNQELFSGFLRDIHPRDGGYRGQGMGKVMTEQGQVSKRPRQFKKSDRQGEQGKDHQWNGNGRTPFRARPSMLGAEEYQDNHPERIKAGQHSADG